MEYLRGCAELRAEDLVGFDGVFSRSAENTDGADNQTSGDCQVAHSARPPVARPAKPTRYNTEEARQKHRDAQKRYCELRKQRRAGVEDAVTATAAAKDALRAENTALRATGDALVACHDYAALMFGCIAAVAGSAWRQTPLPLDSQYVPERLWLDLLEPSDQQLR
jgi:hypothetical protein